jgi:hypothetical protein
VSLRAPFSHSVSLAEAMADLRTHLSPNAILIGQSIHKDSNWLQLAMGIDFHSLINLSDVFRVWNVQHNAFTNFSLDHIAKVWLNIERPKQHDGIETAIISMSLFNAYRHVQWFPAQLFDYQKRTLLSPRIPGYTSLYPVVDGCW